MARHLHFTSDANGRESGGAGASSAASTLAAAPVFDSSGGPNGALTVTVEHTNVTTVLRLTGALTADRRNLVAAAIARAFEDAPTRMIFDLGGVVRCDRTGLTVIADATDRAREGGIPVGVSRVAWGFRQLLPSWLGDDLLHDTVHAAQEAVLSQQAIGDPTRLELMREITELRRARPMPDSWRPDAGVDRAVGGLMVVYGMDDCTASDLLHQFARQNHLPIPDLAARLLSMLAEQGRAATPVIPVLQLVSAATGWILAQRGAPEPVSSTTGRRVDRINPQHRLNSPLIASAQDSRIVREQR